MKKICSGQSFLNLTFNLPSVTFTLDLGTWFLRKTLRLMMVNICAT
jgi:hypothetical protein